MWYIVEFTMPNDPSIYSFEAPGIINVILGLAHYVNAMSDGTIVESLTLYPIGE